jgi:tetratricopeptide (TPR) repeat protein
MANYLSSIVFCLSSAVIFIFYSVFCALRLKARPRHQNLFCRACSAFYFFLVLLCSCVLVTHADAQTVVESDMFSGLEAKLEKEQAALTRESAVIETELMLKKNADILQQSAPVIRDQGIVQAPSAPAPKDVLSEAEILRINESLRRAIQQSRRLKEEKERLDQELRSLRGEQRLEQRRFQVMEMQVKDYQATVDRSVRMKAEFDRTVEDLQMKIQMREQALLARIEELQKEVDSRAVVDSAAAGEKGVPAGDMAAEGSLTEQGSGSLQAPADPVVSEAVILKKDGAVIAAQQAGMDVIDLLNDLDTMRQEIRDDEAKIYYNMGNIFFQQGKYDAAVTEYRKALDLSPADASAHFNLAYISGEFLHDYSTALEHYQQYLFLSPAAEDAPLVQEKILEVRLYLRSDVNRNIDDDVRKNRPLRTYSW